MDPPWFNIISLILAIPSIILNLIVLISIYHRRRVGWAIDTLLMFMVGVLDSICGLYVLTLQISYYITNNFQLLIENRTWCSISTVVCGASILSAIIVTSLLSLVRYLAIVKGYCLRTSVWLGIAIISVMLAFSILSILAILYYPKAMPSGLYCFPLSFENSQSSMLVFVISLFILLILSLTTIAICYGSISAHLQRHFNTTSHQLKLIIILIGYAITLIPELYLLCKEAIQLQVRTQFEDGTATCCLFCITIVNALFVLTLHHETRQECLKIFTARYRDNHASAIRLWGGPLAL